MEAEELEVPEAVVQEAEARVALLAEPVVEAEAVVAEAEAVRAAENLKAEPAVRAAMDCARPLKIVLIAQRIAAIVRILPAPTTMEPANLLAASGLFRFLQEMHNASPARFAVFCKAAKVQCAETTSSSQEKHANAVRTAFAETAMTI